MDSDPSGCFDHAFNGQRRVPMNAGVCGANRFWCRRLSLLDQSADPAASKNAPTALTPGENQTSVAPGLPFDRQKSCGATWLPSCCKMAAATAAKAFSPSIRYRTTMKIPYTHSPDWAAGTPHLLEDQVSHLLHQLVSCLLWCFTLDNCRCLLRIQIQVQSSFSRRKLFVM